MIRVVDSKDGLIPEHGQRLIAVQDSSRTERAGRVGITVTGGPEGKQQLEIGLSETEMLDLIDALQLQLMDWRARK